MISEEDLNLHELLIGLDESNRDQEYHSQVYEDAIRNFSQSIGDDNPLYCNPDYAATTRWQGVVAPQVMAAIINSPLFGARIDKQIKQQTRGLFKGCQTFVSGGTWQWFRPIESGDRLYSFHGEESMQLKDSEFGGKSLHLVHRYVKFNQRAEVVGIYRMLRILSERKKARKKEKYKDIESPSYSAQEIEKIDARYLSESRRADKPRYWEDVNIGDPIDAIQKGPLTVTDVILAHCAGYGLAPYRMLASARIAASDRQRMPNMYTPNRYGVPDTAARVHWDSEAAQKTGNPEAYDWGMQREFWLYHAISDWMGDDAFVLSMQDEIRRFNYLGDLQTIDGTVVAKNEAHGLSSVDLELKSVNQRGETTAEAKATVSLPRRGQAAGLPEPPAVLTEKAKQFLAAHQEQSRAKA